MERRRINAEKLEIMKKGMQHVINNALPGVNFSYLAKVCGISKQKLHNWLKRSKEVDSPKIYHWFRDELEKKMISPMFVLRRKQIEMLLRKPQEEMSKEDFEMINTLWAQTERLNLGQTVFNQTHKVEIDKKETIEYKEQLLIGLDSDTLDKLLLETAKKEGKVIELKPNVDQPNQYERPDVQPGDRGEKQTAS